MEKKYRSLIVGTFYGLKKLEGVKKDKTTFLSLRHGLSTIIEKEVEEAKKAGYDLHLNSKVTNFEKTDDNKYVVTSGDKKYQGDNVVFAIQNYETDELVKKYIDVEDLLNTEYVSVAIVILFYKKEEIKNKLDASGFVIPQNENKFITACTWFSKKWPHSSSDDVVLRAFVGRKGDDRFMSMTDDEIIANVKKDLSDIMEVDATPIRIIVSRVEKSMPQYVVGHLDKVANFKQKLAEKLKGVYSLGAGHTAIGMPDSVAMAKEVAEKILS